MRITILNLFLIIHDVILFHLMYRTMARSLKGSTLGRPTLRPSVAVTLGDLRRL